MSKNLNNIICNPPGPPKGFLYYVEYTYDDKLRERKKKLDKIIENIKDDKKNS